MSDLPEPSVLDYVIARLMPWKAKGELPSLDAPSSGEDQPQDAAAESVLQADGQPQAVDRLQSPALPWRTGLGLALALGAQFILEPNPDPGRWQRSLLFYAAALALLGWAWFKGEWRFIASRASTPAKIELLSVRITPLIISLALAPVAFLAFGGNMFTELNVTLWVICVGAAIFAFWLPGPTRNASKPPEESEARSRVFTFQFSLGRGKEFQAAISPWTLLVAAIFLVAIFFRFSELAQIPPEMNSDHAEKLLDVVDVLNGQTRIFFPRNTGREALQFYLIALTAQLLGTGVSFLSMKIGTVLAGMLTLPYIYLFGKDYGGRWAGLFALALAGIAAWPNILSRVALRFSLYPLFTAPVLYHLLRGLRSGQRNHFILAGIFLGIGLHGYTPMRIVPVVILVAVGLYLLHTRDAALRRQALLGLGTLIIIAALIFLPLARFAQEYPDLFAYRAFTRLLDWEKPIPAQFTALLGVFVQNAWNALIMPIWNTGAIWPVTVPGRPGLDIASGALFVIGMAALAAAYLRRRRWEDLFLALSVPMLMLPSSLSLAFPAENPAPNRMGGALVPIFVIAGLAAASLLSAFRSRKLSEAGSDAMEAAPAHEEDKDSNPWGKGRLPLPALLAVLAIFGMAASQNYSLVFNQYRDGFAAASWNTSEMGKVIRDYINSFGEPDTAWVVAVPHWVDTRLVGIQAGQPTRDYAVFPENLEALASSETRPLLFIVRGDDIEDLTRLQQIFPQGVLKTYNSRYEFKDFFLFYTPGQQPVVP